MEAPAIKLELNDLLSTAQPSSPPSEVATQGLNPEPQAKMDTSHDPQDTRSVERSKLLAIAKTKRPKKLETSA